MTIPKPAYAVFFFVTGLGVGVSWSPLRRSSETPRGNRAAIDAESLAGLARMRKMGGQETVEFLRQFENMTIRIQKYPVDAWASRDGRFVIRLFGRDETIASDLYYPELGGAMNDIVREYTFSSGDQTFSCNFWRGIKDPKITAVQFRLTDARDRDLVYLDTDGDGRWDRLSDYTQEPPVFFDRDGVCWKKRTNDTPKQPDLKP